MSDLHLWPAHPHPYHNELLSSWLVRTAHANGLKVQTFCNLVFGNNYEIWNRDIDRYIPEWIVTKLSEKSGISAEKIDRTSLRRFQGILFDKVRPSGHLTWVNSLQIYHRKRVGYGLLFCPLCLAEDYEPYFRVSWRVACYTFCPKHKVILHDRCSHCGAGVAFHRQEMGNMQETAFRPLKFCWQCKTDLACTETQPVTAWSGNTLEQWRRLLVWLEHYPVESSQNSYRDSLKILHHFATLLTSQRLAPKLYSYLCLKTGSQPQKIDKSKRTAWESRELIERHHTLDLCWWLMDNYPDNLFQAWKDGVLRYNHMLKDFDDCPEEFRKLVATLNRNSRKNLYRKQHLK